jgi:transcriptional regulator with XRE-family HTH domain
MNRSQNISPRTQRIRRKAITNVSRTIKALRLLKGLGRAEAGHLVGVSAQSFEQIENGRSFMTSERIKRYVRSLGFEMRDFYDTQSNVKEILRDLERKLSTAPKQAPKPRRNLHKIITKEVRVIRILRKRRGLTQYQAAEACDYANSIFGQIENGRIELPRDRIEHIVRSLGYSPSDFDRLMKVEVLRDEMIERCTEYLESLEDNKLESAQLVIKSLMK